MELSSFQIPKKKVPPVGTKEIPKGSRDWKELWAEVTNCFWKPMNSHPLEWAPASMSTIHNKDLEKKYCDKRDEQRCQRQSTSHLTERRAFQLTSDHDVVDRTIKFGWHTNRAKGSTVESYLGDGSKGVHLLRYPDIRLRSAPPKCLYLIVFRYCQGRPKSVRAEQKNMIEPTPNYDCHLPDSEPVDTDASVVQIMKSYVYCYEYDEDCLASKCPRQCVPHAIIKLKPGDQMPVRSLTNPVAPNRWSQSASRHAGLTQNNTAEPPHDHNGNSQMGVPTGLSTPSRSQAVLNTLNSALNSCLGNAPATTVVTSNVSQSRPALHSMPQIVADRNKPTASGAAVGRPSANAASKPTGGARVARDPRKAGRAAAPKDPRIRKSTSRSLSNPEHSSEVAFNSIDQSVRDNAPMLGQVHERLGQLPETPRNMIPHWVHDNTAAGSSDMYDQQQLLQQQQQQLHSNAVYARSTSMGAMPGQQPGFSSYQISGSSVEAVMPSVTPIVIAPIEDNSSSGQPLPPYPTSYMNQQCTVLNGGYQYPTSVPSSHTFPSGPGLHRSTSAAGPPPPLIHISEMPSVTLHHHPTVNQSQPVPQFPAPNPNTTPQNHPMEHLIPILFSPTLTAYGLAGLKRFIMSLPNSDLIPDRTYINDMSRETLTAYILKFYLQTRQAIDGNVPLVGQNGQVQSDGGSASNVVGASSGVASFHPSESYGRAAHHAGASIPVSQSSAVRHSAAVALGVNDGLPQQSPGSHPPTQDQQNSPGGAGSSPMVTVKIEPRTHNKRSVDTIDLTTETSEVERRSDKMKRLFSEWDECHKMKVAVASTSNEKFDKRTDVTGPSGTQIPSTSNVVSSQVTVTTTVAVNTQQAQAGILSTSSQSQGGPITHSQTLSSSSSSSSSSSPSPSCISSTSSVTLSSSQRTPISSIQEQESRLLGAQQNKENLPRPDELEACDSASKSVSPGNTHFDSAWGFLTQYVQSFTQEMSSRTLEPQSDSGDQADQIESGDQAMSAAAARDTTAPDVDRLASLQTLVQDVTLGLEESASRVEPVTSPGHNEPASSALPAAQPSQEQPVTAATTKKKGKKKKVPTATLR